MRFIPTNQEYRLLRELDIDSGLGVQELARRARMRRSRSVFLLGELERRKLVEVIHHDSHNQPCWKITGSGHEGLATITSWHQQRWLPRQFGDAPYIEV